MTTALQTKEAFTWDELANMEGTSILRDWFDDGVRCLIMRGPAALCVYLGVSSSHPLAGHEYDDLPINCHGGLTFAGEGDDTYRPSGFYWYGWDYGHAGDRSFYDLKLPEALRMRDEKEWLVADVESDMWEAVWNFRHLIKLAEAIANKYRVEEQP